MVNHPATFTMHTPTGPVHCCVKHACTLENLMRFMGTHCNATKAPEGAQCSNCENEADRAAPADAPPVAQADDMRDAYVGAREDLLDWKRRALAAEAALRDELTNSKQLVRALREATEPPTFMGEPVIAPPVVTPAAPTEPPLIGRWHHGHGHLVSGTVRISRWDCDNNPPVEFRDQMLDWICSTLNAAVDAWEKSATDEFAAPQPATPHSEAAQPREAALKFAGASGPLGDPDVLGAQPLPQPSNSQAITPAKQEQMPGSAAGNSAQISRPIAANVRCQHLPAPRPHQTRRPAMGEPNEPDCCQSCIGTGIGWGGPDSKCACCNGTGRNMPAPKLFDQDRWAFNHFEPDPGEEEAGNG